ncbi:hypothetical protein N0B51_00915 [Tsuneonella sp. YG55]|uniref:Uncharacterized protein n=1 Tax=Tsuneonella litorea TaxID=2976475 RepID=A0A9X2VYS8_9SPHN|nr:hypothetical protein [Tsuneonella litorea]MCT2557533.1 hypothetical protein [Tsuneonella litorea]
MADLYWLTFRLEKNGSWQRRYDALKSTISDCTTGGKWWVEPTSFILFRSEVAIGDIAALISDAIDTNTDVALLAMTDYKSARVIGTVRDADLFSLWPDAKRA